MRDAAVKQTQTIKHTSFCDACMEGLNLIPAKMNEDEQKELGYLLVRALYLYEMRKDQVARNDAAKYLSSRLAMEDREDLFMQFSALVQLFGLCDTFQKMRGSKENAEDLVEDATDDWDITISVIADPDQRIVEDPDQANELKDAMIADAHMFSSTGGLVIRSSPEEGNHLMRDLFSSVFRG